MSKRKGVSADEKRNRLLDLFYEKKEFFQLKELEKIAPKEKGIVAQSVKEVLQSLVDDGMVDSEKIGTSIYFWAFPSKAKSEKKAKLETIMNSLNENKNKLATLNDELESAKKEHDDLEERSAAIQQLTELQETHKKLLKEISRYSHCDPAHIDKIRNNSLKVKDAANRWTENLYSIKSWCKLKIAADEGMFNKQFGIPEDLDYIEI
ncbi:meiotic nuclear division protein 1 homolog [Arctopsyche grandis]|uniref:meiotic nuclear division protein 1 homolog n=1 Tax=Arctopsyche grandis TaxID=121162 RepID=UPI00406D7E7D